MLFSVLRAILHDPEQYPDPEEFMPERFLKDGELNAAIRDPGVAAFGAGRRYAFDFAEYRTSCHTHRYTFPELAPEDTSAT